MNPSENTPAPDHPLPRCGKWMAPGFVPGLVSVIVPTHNRERFILDCVDSVHRQTHRPIELIVVDDGSADGTQALLEKWWSGLADRTGITFIPIKQDKQGANVARNKGLAESRGEFIQFLDSDDALLPEKLEKALRLMSEHDADYSYCVTGFCNVDMTPAEGGFGVPPGAADSEFLTYSWQTMGPLYRRRVVESVGPWNEAIFSADDWEYGARVKLQGWRGCFDPERGALLRVYPRAGRKTPERKLAEARDYFHAYARVADLMGRRDGTAAEGARKRMGRRFLICGIQLGSCGDFATQREAFGHVRRLGPARGVEHLIASTCAVLRFKWWNRALLRLLLKWIGSRQ